MTNEMILRTRKWQQPQYLHAVGSEASAKDKQIEASSSAYLRCCSSIYYVNGRTNGIGEIHTHAHATLRGYMQLKYWAGVFLT